ncbi:hypothetical protein GCM10009682_42410 [Luedemannella flava]|uniref:Uncharacterized protein n=1 Tax=Luedemannella flava TaxID=349316 RepID=A0ABP4YMI6_9ACTN
MGQAEEPRGQPGRYDGRDNTSPHAVQDQDTEYPNAAEVRLPVSFRQHERRHEPAGGVPGGSGNQADDGRAERQRHAGGSHPKRVSVRSS